MKKQLLIAALLIVFSATGSSVSQKMGIGERVSVSVERADHGIIDRTGLYCMQNGYTFCREPGLFDVLIVMIDAEERYASYLNGGPVDAQIVSLNN